jgi:hemerythrin-like domain-containing protein
MKQETKPIKRSVELAPLSREHHDGLLFVWKLKEGLAKNVSAERLKKFTFWFWQQHIKPHFYQEEKILSPHLSPADPMLVRMSREHENIREFILNLDRDADAQTFKQLADLLNDHIRFEERELFTHLERILSKETLGSIFQELEKHPVCASDWEDEFWVKN